MNKLLIIYGSVLLCSSAMANDQQRNVVLQERPDTISTLENNFTALNINADLNESTTGFSSWSHELNLNEIEYVEEEPEVDLGFDTSDYLPKDFNPYASYFDLNSII